MTVAERIKIIKAHRCVHWTQADLPPAEKSFTGEPIVTFCEPCLTDALKAAYTDGECVGFERGFENGCAAE